MLKRHEIQVLRRAGHSQVDVARLAGVARRTVQRIDTEAAVTHIDTARERDTRGIGRPAKAEPFRSVVAEILAQEPQLLSVDILRRVKLKGYTGGKTALYALISALRPKTVRPVVRFEGLPGEFSQHDFGHVDVAFLNGTEQRVHFFASRLKYSRWVEVTIVPDERAETLVRTWVDHFAAIGGVALLAVFDRPKTVALKWTRDGHVTDWNPLFAGVALDLSVGIEVCWPASPWQAIVEEEGFTRAARKLGRTQPAVSCALRRLESALGEALMPRTSSDPPAPSSSFPQKAKRPSTVGG